MAELLETLRNLYTRATAKRGKDVELPAEEKPRYDTSKYNVAERFAEVARRAKESGKK